MNAGRRGGGDVREDIAIVGMSCLFPGADTVSRYWHNIVHKVDCITDAPPDWQPELFFDPEGEDTDRSYTQKGGFLGDVSRFDPTRYGVVPRSVDGAEPDHYLALRCAFEAFTDAGVPEVPLERSRTGVIIGRGLFVNRGWVSVFQRTFAVDQVIGVLRRLEPGRSEEDFAALRAELKRNLPTGSAEAVPGLVHSALVGRIANRLDLNGPAYTIDAACSSGLLAVEHGMRELRGGSCDAVLVGGSQVSTPAQVHVLFCHLTALSAEGRIAPFSADAAGTVLGQGCGMLVLKRRGDAERDGNRIYALLKDIGVSSDGKGAGLLAPLSEGQQLSMRRAYERAGISPMTVGLIEAHGTGIPLGDATEFESLEACMTGDGTREPFGIGSVKSMIGHLIPASGAASLIKTALALYHRVLPPTLHAEKRNPDLGWQRTRAFLINEARPWLHGNRTTPRRAGINAFGFGGINAHAILEEYTDGEEPEPTRLECEWPAELVLVSAPNRDALGERLHSVARWVEAAGSVRLLDIAATCAKDHGASRMAVVARSREDLVKKLRHAAGLLADPERDRIVDRRHGLAWFDQPLGRTGRVAFVFPGEGAQYVNMLDGLCRHFPEVRRQFDLTAAALAESGADRPFGHVLFPQPAGVEWAEETLYGLESAVASVTAAGRGLLDLLASLGVLPDAIVGHSSGEFGALLAAGAYEAESEEDGIRSIVAGARSARELERSELVPTGGLLSVGGTKPEVVAEVLERFDGRLVVAMENCPRQLVLAGSEADVQAAHEALSGKGGLCERLRWNRSYHTEAFRPASEIIERFYDTFEMHTPKVELWSCATAARYPEDPRLVKELAVRQWSSPVRFRETIEAMYDAGVRLFVEVGPRGNLSAFIADTLADRPHAVVPMDLHRKESIQQLCTAVGMLAAQGVEVDLAPLTARRGPRLLDLAEDPPAEPHPDPHLSLAFPLLEIGDEALEDLRTRFGAGGEAEEVAARPTASVPPPASPPPAGSHTGEGQADPVLPRTAAQPAVAPTVAAGSDPGRLRAIEDFQRTMQAFLDAQRRVMAASATAALDRTRNGLVPAPAESPAASSPPTPAAGAPPPAAPLAPPTHAAPVPDAGSPAKEAAPLPFLREILEHVPGRRLVAECQIDTEEHRFLADHTFFGRGLSRTDPDLTALPIMPLAMTLELLAEAAVALMGDLEVRALADIETFKWLPFETSTRRLRTVAEALDETRVAVSVFEADREGMSGEVARAIVELGDEPADLGPSVLGEVTEPAPPWSDGDTYKVLYHGPAFQGVEGIDRWGPGGIQARVRVPDPGLLFRDTDPAGLILPVVLIDTASQIPGTANGSMQPTDETISLAFPNTTGRLEFVPNRPAGEPLTAVVRHEQDETVLRSTVEMIAADGRVVLRYADRVEELVEFPLGPYLYRIDPLEVTCSRDITSLFGEAAGIERCTVCEVERVGGRVLVNHLWLRVLARMVLDRAEREVFDRGALAPVAAAGWVLERIAAKDAARLRAGARSCMADVGIESDGSGTPRALLAGERPRAVGMASEVFHAVAAAVDEGRVGIAVEPLGDLGGEELEAVFHPEERELLATVPGGPRALRAAKEAVGEALGGGLPGGPRSVRFLRGRVEDGRCYLSAVVEGHPAGASSTGEADALEVTTVVDRGHCLALCLLPD